MSAKRKPRVWHHGTVLRKRAANAETASKRILTTSFPGGEINEDFRSVISERLWKENRFFWVKERKVVRK